VDPVFATHPPHRTIGLLMVDQPFDSLKTLLKELKCKQTHYKSYSHLHYYARRFVTGYREPPKLSKVQINNFMSFFAQVEMMFERSKMNCSFFSYPWLCRKMLVLFGHERFVPFVKTIICKKRNAKYELLWENLGLNIVLKEFRIRFKGFDDTFTNGRSMGAN